MKIECCLPVSGVPGLPVLRIRGLVKGSWGFMVGVESTENTGGAKFFRPLAIYGARQVARVLVLEHGRLPTTDIYLRPRLASSGMPEAEYLNIARNGPDGINPDGLFVIICRYINGPWLKWLESHRSMLAGVVFMVDDDLPAMIRDINLPLLYRLKIWRLHGRYIQRLSHLASELWVSSPELAQRYEEAEPRLLEPLYVESAGQEQPVRCFYHGTAAHGREIRWLRDIVLQVQERNPHTVFEIAGGWKIRRLYRGIERVSVLPPMDWPTYLGHNMANRFDIGLAPLLEGTVNDARSHTRFFDITRAGAAGIYANRPPYARFVRDGEDGVLLAADKQAWVEAIVTLADDAARRKRIAAAASLRAPVHDDALAFLSDRAGDIAEAAE